MIILCLLGFFGVSGQRYSNLNVFEGSDGGSQANIVTDGNNFYTLFDLYRDSLFLNKSFVATVADGNSSSLVLSKFEHQYSDNKIKLRLYQNLIFCVLIHYFFATLG